MGNRNARKTCLRVEVMEERIALSSLRMRRRRAHAAVVRQSSLIRKLTQELTGTNITSASVDPPDRDCRTSGFSRIAAEC